MNEVWPYAWKVSGQELTSLEHESLWKPGFSNAQQFPFMAFTSNKIFSRLTKPAQSTGNFIPRYAFVWFFGQELGIQVESLRKQQTKHRDILLDKAIILQLYKITTYIWRRAYPLDQTGQGYFATRLQNECFSPAQSLSRTMELWWGPSSASVRIGFFNVWKKWPNWHSTVLSRSEHSPSTSLLALQPLLTIWSCLPGSYPAPCSSSCHACRHAHTLTVKPQEFHPAGFKPLCKQDQRPGTTFCRSISLTPASPLITSPEIRSPNERAV